MKGLIVLVFVFILSGCVSSSEFEKYAAVNLAYGKFIVTLVETNEAKAELEVSLLKFELKVIRKMCESRGPK